jgi:thiol-disulfide isomerase/thioredoxin
VKRIKDVQQFSDLIQGEQPVIAVFKTTWCPDCHFIEPFMPELVKQFSDLKFVEVDRDELPELFEQYDVMGIPSFIAFKKGQELTRFVSKLRKTKEEIETYLKRTSDVAKHLA